MVEIRFNPENIVEKIDITNISLKDGINKISKTDNGITLYAKAIGSKIISLSSKDKDDNPLDMIFYSKAEQGNNLKKICVTVCTASNPPYCWEYCGPPIVIEA